MFISNDPSEHRFISCDEKDYILSHRIIPCGDIEKNKPPFLRILLTPTVWVIAFCDFAISFGGYMILIEGPSFMNNVLNEDILEVLFRFIYVLYLLIGKGLFINVPLLKSN